uniref:Fungal lipase-type domain-containing protein n=1 Tax=viral metagenome TaxID=1070528 RepID=A0A6C0BUB3_9ZZZZ
MTTSKQKIGKKQNKTFRKQCGGLFGISMGNISMGKKPLPVSVNTTSTTNVVNGIGNVSLITFIGTVMSRLTYLKDCGYLERYMQIFGDHDINLYTNTDDYKIMTKCKQYTDPPVFNDTLKENPIPTSVLNSIKNADIKNIFDDAEVYKEGPNVKFFKNSDGKDYVDFLNYAKHVNYVNRETNITGDGAEVISNDKIKKQENTGTDAQDLNIDITNTDTMNTDIINPPQENNIINQINDPNGNVKCISVAWSNYSIAYIVADKRMNSIWVSFRGTASVKSMMSYLNVTAAYPQKICPDGDGYLSGIYKLTSEHIHTILESMRDLVNNFLKSDNIKVFTSGHSLGGAMCTIFSYLWIGIKKTPPYNDAGFEKLSDSIVCISVASPRVLNKTVCDKYQEFIKNKQIMYKRVMTKGDPVIDLPLEMQGFYHPTKGMEDNEIEVMNYCENLSSFITGSSVNFFSSDKAKQQGSKQVKIAYDKPLNCVKKIPPAYIYSSIRNPLAHPFYLYISFFKVMFNPTVGEIARTKAGTNIKAQIAGGDTLCRVIISNASKQRFAGFFKSNESRIQESTGVFSKYTGKIGEKFNIDPNKQDVLMTIAAFDNLKSKMTKLDNNNINQVDPLFMTPVSGIDIFNKEHSSPNVNCLNSNSTKIVGGKKRNNRSHKIKHKKVKHNKTKK